MDHPQAIDVSVVVCTKNSISAIRACLQSLRDSGVSDVVVVDASSTDGTRKVCEALADIVLRDPGNGLGQARNVGLSKSSKRYILNSGPDNISRLPRFSGCLIG